MPEVIQESVRVSGPRRLAGELAYSIEPPRAGCLLVNPHPYMGGRMDNNVITKLAAKLSAANIATLRFDYAGVGASEGTPADVVSAMAAFWSSGHAPVDAMMVEDAANSLQWLRRQLAVPLFVIGYSFGAYVATRIVEARPAGLVLISPTIKHHHFDLNRAPDVPKLVIYSDNDFATDPATMARWLDSLPPPKKGRRIDGGQHFFRGMEHEVASETLAFCNQALQQRSETA